MSDPPKISLRGVPKRFGAKQVLAGIDLDVGVGESVVVIGGSGSGKSVTLKCVLGLLRPEAGSIKVDGEETVGMPSRARDRLLAQVGLGAAVGELSPAELSGGMRKRVGLARAIASEPKIIFFDEPTTGLDPIMGDVINDLIVECVKELGATALSITHDMASARKIADRIAMIYNGTIIWDGPVGDVDHSANAHVDQFIHGRAEGPIQMELRRA